MKKGQYQKAYDSLLRLRNNPVQAARDLYYIHSQLELEAEIIGTSPYHTRFVELFTIVSTTMTLKSLSSFKTPRSGRSNVHTMSPPSHFE